MSAPDRQPGVFPGGKRYRTLGPVLHERFGGPVRKAGVETGSGCTNPQRCLFCRSGESGDDSHAAQRDTVALQLQKETGRLLRRHPGRRFIAYFRNYSLRHGPAAWLQDQLEAAAACPGVVGLALAMRPDELSVELADRLARLAETIPCWVELGLQSCDAWILRDMRRGHTVADFSAATALLRTRRIETIAHLVFGWPGETAHAPARAAAFLSESGVRGVKLHHLQVLAGTALADRFRKTPFPCLTAEAYIEQTAVFLSNLAPEVVVHRLFTRSPGDTLLAPRWEPSQQALTSMLDRHLLENGLWQGSCYLNRLLKKLPKHPFGEG
jgi:hypothetical protein